MKDHPKIETFDPKTHRLGVDTPEHIYNSLEDIKNALDECKPYQPVAQEDNRWFLEVSKREAIKIVEYVGVIERLYALSDHPSLYDQWALRYRTLR